ncbi:MAG: hypothetical protein AAF479_13045, partial [Pseudomonadota bacterium]
PMAREINPEIVQVLATPIPEPHVAVSAAPAPRLHASLRCIGLAGASKVVNCSQRMGRACEISTAQAKAVRDSLWPRDSMGPILARMNNWIYSYERAYTALADVESREARESSELILRRDSAMCRRHLEFHEARAHGSKDRQSG